MAANDDVKRAPFIHEWIEVAKRRIKDFDEGKVEGIPIEDVFRELEEEFGEDHERSEPRKEDHR
jgi:hypothetical protein